METILHFLLETPVINFIFILTLLVLAIIYLFSLVKVILGFATKFNYIYLFVVSFNLVLITSLYCLYK